MTVINQFLENPLDLGDKKAEQLLQKKRRRRRRRREPSPMDDGTIPFDEQKKKKEKKQKEIKIYKSAQFIVDSDDDAEAMEAFFAKEKALRERTALAALASGKDNATMKPTGTKKRRKRNAEDGGKRKRKKESVKDVEEHALSRDPSPVVEDADSDENPFDPFASPKGPTENIPRVRPRPRPRRIAKATPKTLTPEPHGSSGSPPKPPDQDDSIHKDTEGSPPASNSKPTRRKVVVISDDDE